MFDLCYQIEISDSVSEYLESVTGNSVTFACITIKVKGLTTFEELNICGPQGQRIIDGLTADSRMQGFWRAILRRVLQDPEIKLSFLWIRYL